MVCQLSPIAFQLDPRSTPRTPPPVRLAPFISQIATCRHDRNPPDRRNPICVGGLVRFGSTRLGRLIRCRASADEFRSPADRLQRDAHRVRDMIQRGPGRGVGRQPDETSNDEVSSHGRLARARGLGPHLDVLWDISWLFKANGELVFSTHRNRAGSGATLSGRRRRDGAAWR